MAGTPLLPLILQESTIWRHPLYKGEKEKGVKIGILIPVFPAARHGEGAAVLGGDTQLGTPAPSPAPTDLS